MKKSCASKALHAVCIFLLFLALQINAAPKTIQLRNNRITTELPAKPASAMAADSKPASGLFLIQFTGPLQAEWRTELQREKIKLLRYVPEDAFVARVSHSSLAQIRSHPFVQHVEPYRAEYKIHAALRRKPAKPGAAAEELRIRALLSPDATPQDLAKARGTLRKLEKESVLRFGNTLQGTVTPEQLDALANSPSVLWIEPAPKMKLFDEIGSKIVGGDDGEASTPTITQQLGFDGSGITVAVADSGLMEGDADTMHPDLAGRVDAFFHYGNLEDAADEHSHGTHVAGIIGGNAATGETDDNGYRYGLGVAPGSHIIAQRIFDGEGVYEAPPSYETLTHDAVRAGADIGSNSWGDDTQGRYDLSAAEFDELVRDADAGTVGDQQYILEFSAGNAGPGTQTIGSPAVAKNVIASGAVENNRFDLFIYDSGQETMADFSSRGPCEDGRIKPDVVAPGTWIASLRSSLANDENAWADISQNYMYQGGTSQSGPHVSGAAAVFSQFYRETITNALPSPALVKAALINSAVDCDPSGGTEAVPNNDEGWGRVDLTQIIDSPRRYEFVDQSVVMTNNQVFEKKVLVASSSEPLKITLAYTDVPALPAALIALVNDLDLEVVGPNGAVYRGNQFLNGDSVPNAPSFDRINNVEAVHLNLPAPGEYVIRVSAHNVAEDARADTAAVDQDFALVFSGDLPFPGQGVLFFDRNAYRAPDTVNVRLIDFDLVAQNSVAIQIKSTTEPAGKTLTLSRTSPGSFAGNIATVTGTAGSGQLRVTHGDTITASYQDVSPPASLTATAQADLVPPNLTGVSSTNRFGRTIISWQTDEAANSIVHYGTNLNLTLLQTNSLLTVQHGITLQDLVPGKTYQFIVVSTDEAGNTTTNNNGGALFSFVAEPPALALLVNAYTYDSEWEDMPEIPLSSYTDALNAAGVGYEIWDVSTDGSPQLADLKPYQVVIWRVNDSFWNYVYDANSGSINPAQQAAIASYVGDGGAFFMSSMEILSRLGEVPFRTNLLHVSSFQEDVGLTSVEGVLNDPVTSGLSLALDYSAYPNNEDFGVAQDLSDTIVTTTNATPIFFDSFGEMAGVRFPRTGSDSSGRVVFFPFPLDVVPVSEAAPNNRASLVRNVFNFLVPGLNGFGSVSFNNNEYTIPSLATVEVADSDLAGQGAITIQVASDSMPSGRTLTLHETARPGLFRGTIQLVATTNSAGADELVASQGQQIRAEYFDASANSSLFSYATIDTIPPIVSNVAVEPDYLYSFVSWDTSKPADGLVQFGESALLNRTAYDANLSDVHELILTGLQANKTYFYQVVSRDNAGNTVVDDNHGQLYTFRTLTPFYPPWADSLEGDTSKWQVIAADGSQVEWELGIPNNSRENSAHSPTKAWGSNLNGQSIDEVETWLISPAVQLPANIGSTLRFWHSYDFPEIDVLEQADLSVTTDGGNTWTALKAYTDANSGWEEEQINLSPYRGQVVQFSWHYLVFSLEGSPRPGWLIDDVSVTEGVEMPFAFTSLVYTNGQAQFTFSAPTGSSCVIEASTDLINWIPIQTNTVGATETTFIDVQSPNFPTRFYRLKK